MSALEVVTNLRRCAIQMYVYFTLHATETEPLATVGQISCHVFHRVVYGDTLLCSIARPEFITSSPRRCAKYCNKRVCLFVCLSARISQKPRVQNSLNFLYMLPVAEARSSSDDNSIRYVLPVL